MNKELIIKSTPSGAEIALLEDKVLVELHKESKNNVFSVGDIFLGKIKKIIPGLNAAFVDVGYQKDAFIHYSDLGENIKSFMSYTDKAIKGQLQTHLLDKYKFEPIIPKVGKIDSSLPKKQNILVQVSKEPISTKGPRLNAEVNIAGRFLVLTPFNNTIGISKKIASQDERNRLKKLIESIRPKNFGVIVRTVAEGKTVAQLHEDLNEVVGKWEQITKKLKGTEPPQKVLSEANKTSVILRDFLNESFNNISTNNDEIYEDLKSYVKSIAPEKEAIVNNYKLNIPIFDHYGVTKQIKSTFGKHVTMKSGAYLVIEHTEALHVVDVNSGHKVSSNATQEENALAVNIESGLEVARQLRLRDIGGIIIIDFIDLKSFANRKKLYDTVVEAMKPDRAKHTVLQLSKFGLMQITRERVRPQLNINTTETCPSCNGTGEIEASILLTDEIETDLRYLVENQNQKGLQLMVHPFVEAYIKKNTSKSKVWWKKNSMLQEWQKEYSSSLRIYSNDDYQLTEFRFFDKNGEEIELE